MKGQLIINNLDAFTNWGIEMGEGFISTLTAPVPMKDVIENKSRTTHGKKYILSPKKDERDISLTFIITGKTREEFLTNKKAFYEELFKQEMSINVPSEGEEVYHLLYTGKSITYNQSLDGTTGKLAVKFNEPDPSNREKSAQSE